MNSLPAEQALRPGASVSSGYALVRIGVDDVASVDVNEKVVAAEEIGTQHRALDIGENKRPCELAEAQV